MSANHEKHAPTGQPDVLGAVVFEAAAGLARLAARLAAPPVPAGALELPLYAALTNEVQRVQQEHLDPIFNSWAASVGSTGAGPTPESAVPGSASAGELTAVPGSHGDADMSGLTAAWDRLPDLGRELIALFDALQYLPVAPAIPLPSVVLGEMFPGRQADRRPIARIAGPLQTPFGQPVPRLLGGWPLDLSAGWIGGQQAMILPVGEEDHPLMWPLLVRQLAPWLDRELGITVSACRSMTLTPAELQAVLPMARELSADALAARVLGPTLYMALAATYPLSRQGWTAEQEALTRLRLDSLWSDLQERGLDTESAAFYRQVETVTAQMGDAAAGDPAVSLESGGNRLAGEHGVSPTWSPAGVDAWGLAGVIRTAAGDVAEKAFDQACLQQAHALAARLADGILIAAMPVRSPADVRHRLAAGEDGQAGEQSESGTGDSLYDVMGMAQDVPAEAADIIMAGWLHKYRVFLGQGAATPDQGVWHQGRQGRDAGPAVRAANGIVLRSLEIAAVHHLYAKGVAGE